MRQVALGGGERAGLFGRRGAVSNAAVAAAVVVAAMIGLSGSAWWSWLIAVLLVAATLGAVTPLEPLGGRTLAARVARTILFRRRAQQGLLQFTPGEPAFDRRGRATTGPRFVPSSVGRVVPVTVTAKAGGHEGQVCVLIHRSTVGVDYATVVLEVETGGGGVRDSQDIEEEYQRWGRVKSALAAPGSLVRGLQQVERIQPPSIVAHERFLLDAVPEGVKTLLVRSYVNVLDLLSWKAERHLTLVVLRMPFTVAWDSTVKATFGEVCDATHARQAVAEASRVTQLLLGEGGARRVRPLSERELAASIRAMLRDDWSWGETSDVDGEPLTLNSCWPAYDASDKTMLVVQGQRWVRIARVDTRFLPPDPVSVTIFRRLVTGIYPTVVRTLVMTEDLVPAAKARGDAKAEATIATASAVADATRVADGSSSDRLTSAQVRLRDLRPGTGYHASNWTMHIAISADSAQALARATTTLEGAAGDIGIPLEWLDEEHDLALTSVLPLGRGLKTSTKKVLG